MGENRGWALISGKRGMKKKMEIMRKDQVNTKEDNKDVQLLKDDSKTW